MSLDVDMTKRLPGFRVEISFSCPDGRLLALIGPSGAGKTTIVRMVAGLERPDSGVISYNGHTWVDTGRGVFVPPQKRRLGYVFQEYSLFPHLTVEQNVGFASDDPAYVDHLMELLGIKHLAGRKPHQISGGERQRAAIAQALARRPKVLLLDEPFSALDVLTRKRLREEMKGLKEHLSLPIIHVTHDLDEARYLADEIVCVDQGKRSEEWLGAWFKDGRPVQALTGCP